jgi:hypothetical protein
MNFGGNNIAKGYEWNANMEFKNFWNVYTGGAVRGNIQDQNILRGGPLMKLPGNLQFRIGVTSDTRKKMVIDLFASENKGFENYCSYFNSNASISYKPTNWLVLSFNPGFSKTNNELQYVATANDGNKDKYVFATIDMKTVNASFRVNLNLSPDLTLQYWGQPFMARGKYSGHKLITDPVAPNYSNRYSVFTPEQLTFDGDKYFVDENTDGSTDYSFDKMDFNVQEFLSNMVLRWEYKPGSSVYLVWSQTRNNSGSDNMNILNDIGNLFNTSDNKPHNVFLVKFSYRFGLK